MVQASAAAAPSADDLAKREHARDMSGALVLSLYRLFKTAQIHALDNLAVQQAIEQTLETIHLFSARSGARMTILFAKSTVFVAGQLMKGSRGDYECALELGEMIGRYGLSELRLDDGVTTDDLRALLDAWLAVTRGRAPPDKLARPSDAIRLRRVSPAVLGDDDADLSEEERIVRAYASAIVVLRRVFENLRYRRYELPHEAKRIAQKLVMLSEGDTPAFLGVTAMRNANQDAAGRAVNTSILAVAMARLVTTDLGTLARVAMAALLFDVAEPYVLGLRPPSPDDPPFLPRMQPDDAARLPAATALVLTAMGRLHEASRIRSVIAYEAQWQRQHGKLGPLYDGARTATIAARIVAAAHRYNELLTPDPAARTFTAPDEAVAKMDAEAADDFDRAVVSLLVGAIGMFPPGSLVALSTGEHGVVISTPSHPADFARPVVRVVAGPGGVLSTPHDVDCMEDFDRSVVQVVTDPSPALASALEALRAGGADSRGSARAAIGPSAAAAPAVAIEVAPPAQFTRDISAAPRRDTTVPPHADLAHASSDARISDGEARADADGSPAEGPKPRVAIGRVARRQRLVIREEIVTDRRDWRKSDVPPAATKDAPTRPPPPGYDDLSNESLVPDSLFAAGVPAPRAASAAPAEYSRESGAPPEVVDHLAFGESEPPAARAAVSSDAQPDTVRAPGDAGTLTEAPMPTLLVHAKARELMGSLMLKTPSGAEHGVYLCEGIPRRAFTADRIAPLAPLLVAMGYIREQDLREGGSLAGMGDDEALLESEVLASGQVDFEDLEGTLDEQVQQRVAHLFSLPGDTTYVFHSRSDRLLGKCCSSESTIGAEAILLAGIREYPNEALIDRELARLGQRALTLREDKDLDAFDFLSEEAEVVDVIRSDSPPFALLESGFERSVVRRVVYALSLARSFS